MELNHNDYSVEDLKLMAEGKHPAQQSRLNPDDYSIEDLKKIAGVDLTAGIESAKPWQDRQIPVIGGTARGYALGAVDSLPVAGAIGGGAIAGGPTLGVGAAGGGVVGYGVGEAARRLIRPYVEEGKNPSVLPQGTATQTAGNIAKGVAEPLIEGAMNEMGGQVLNKVVGGAVTKTADALQNLGETKAFKAAGAMLKDFRSQFNKSPERINELGRTMLDNGLVRAGDTVESIAQKSELLKRETGQKIGQTYQKVLDTMTAPESVAVPESILAIQDAGFHPLSQADEMKSLIMSKFKGRPGSTGAINKASQVIDELAMNGNNLTPEHVLSLKGEVDSMINWSKKAQDLPLEQEALKDIRGYIQGRLNNQVSLMDQALGSGSSKELVRLNKLYGNVAEISNIARDKALRESANRSIGLTDTIMGGAGLTAGAALNTLTHGHSEFLPLIMAGAAGGANKLGRTYGNAVLSTGADAAASGLNSIVGASNPQVMNVLGRKMIQLQQQGKGGR